MPKHTGVKTAKRAKAKIKMEVEQKTNDSHEREILMKALETPFRLLSQAEEELQFLIQYYCSGKAKKNDVLTYLSNLNHCIGTSVGHIVGFSL
jgi:hypothetical protein